MSEKSRKELEDEIMKRVLEKLDNVDNRLNDIDKTLIKQEANLEKHMYRTEQNERMIEKIFEDVKPIKKHVAHVEGGLKFLGVISLLGGIALTVLKILGLL